MSEEDQNTIKWAALLHDVSKRQKPVFHGRDHTHPFTGAVTVLNIFERLGFLEEELKQKLGADAHYDKSKLNKLVELIMESTHAPVEKVDPTYGDKFIKEGQDYCCEVQSHDNLEEIFGLLWDEQNPIMIRNGFCDHVFRSVFFHQSLIGLKKFPGIVSSTKEERLQFCDKKFYEIISVLMSNDSISYYFIKEQEVAAENVKEFIENTKEMIDEWEEHQLKASKQFERKELDLDNQQS